MNDDDLDELEEILTRVGMDNGAAPALAALMLLREKHGIETFPFDNVALVWRAAPLLEQAFPELKEQGLADRIMKLTGDYLDAVLDAAAAP